MVDVLTDLPNRRSFLERLEMALARSDRTRSHGALLFLDVDGLKTVNDTLGHPTGDRLLAGFGQRVRSVVFRGLERSADAVLSTADARRYAAMRTHR